ncbi:MAG: hypothetical protein H0T79_23960 [Deltaproteobacteria bacterium]|nr:hypothetical protein [Deltaproteobacteria bacterium]
MRWFVGVLVLAACAKPRPPEPPKPEPTPVVDIVPELAIVQPERGVFVEGGTLVVTGRAHDDAAVRVTVNGVDATVAPDGSFTATLDVPAGLTILETHAIDTTGHDVRDVRSVLVGPFAPSDARAPIAVRLGRGGLAALGKALGASAKSIDVKAAARALNPVFDNGGCLGARADIADLSIGKVEVSLAPKAGAVATMIFVDSIVARFDVRYEVACLGGSTTMTVHTNARITSDLGATVRGGRLQTTLANTNVALEALQMEISGVPGPIENLLRRALRGSVEHALQTIVANDVPPVANAKLASLLAHPAQPPVLGRPVKLEVVPRRFEVTASGVLVAADAAFVVAGGERGRHVAKPASMPGLEHPPVDADVWIAAAAIDQLLSGLWAAHAFDRTLALADLGMVGMLLKGKLHTIEVAFSLPPMIGATKHLELAIGDLILTARDATGAELQRFAVSLRSDLTIEPGEHALATTEPTVLAQQLGNGPGPLDAATVEAIAKTVWSLVAMMVDDSLTRIPVPALGGGVQVRAATARDEFVVLDISASE